MAVISLGGLPAAGTLTPGTDVLHISQSAVDKQITPLALGIYNGNNQTATSAAPTGTASTTAVHMAVGGALTPAYSTRVRVIVAGQMANSTINDGVTVQLRWGTGTAPVNGAAVTGTLAGISQTFTSLVAALKSGFTIPAVITGLSVGTAYWFDVSIQAVTGGTATITGVTMTVEES